MVQSIWYILLTFPENIFCYYYYILTFFTWNQFHEFFTDFTYQAMKIAWRYIYYITVMQWTLIPQRLKKYFPNFISLFLFRSPSSMAISWFYVRSDFWLLWKKKSCHTTFFKKDATFCCLHLFLSHLLKRRKIIWCFPIWLTSSVH